MQMASKSSEFKDKWISKVKHNEGLKKAIAFWARESDRPQFLLMSDEWKRKIINLSYPEKQVLVGKNRVVQEKRTKWMLSADNEPQNITSELNLSSSGQELIIGFRSFIVKEHLGILTKLQDEKGLCKWAVLERN